jgi:hypothetical protein
VNREGEQHQPNLGEVSHADAQQAAREFLNSGLINHPIPNEAEGHLLDVVQHEYPAVVQGLQTLVNALPDMGWTEEQVQLLETGFDMSVILIHSIEHPGTTFPQISEDQ